MWCAEAKAKIDIPLKKGRIVPAGERITITHGNQEKYAIWDWTAIYDLPEEYVGEITKIVSES